MDDVAKYKMIQAMQRYGGSFVNALGQAFMFADRTNTEILLRAFPHYVKEYGPGSKFDKSIDD